MERGGQVALDIDQELCGACRIGPQSRHEIGS
jgi:hypothetical protein